MSGTHRTIRRVTVTLDDDEPEVFLTFDPDDAYATPAADEQVETLDPAQVDPVALYEFLDGEAEGWNRHDFVGLHERLYLLLVEEVGGARAQHVLAHLARHGGLHGLNDLD